MVGTAVTSHWLVRHAVVLSALNKAANVTSRCRGVVFFLVLSVVAVPSSSLASVGDPLYSNLRGHQS